MAGKVIYVEQRMVKSEAWLSLNATATKMFLIFMTKRQIIKSGRKGKETFDITNNGKIVFPYDEARTKYSITAPRFCRGLDDLVAKGFVDITEIGGGVKGYTTKYAISERWRLYGQPQFQKAQRPKRGWGWPGFKTKPTNDFVRATPNENVRGKGKSKGITSNDFVRALNFQNILKWRNDKWIQTKIA